MKRYRFRLDQVLRVRRLQEDQARAEVVSARSEADRTTDDLSHRLADYHQRQLRDAPVSARHFQGDRDHEHRMANAVTAARLAEANALMVLDSRLSDWTAASRRVDALEHLDDVRRREHLTEALRQEQIDLDDLTSARHRGVE